MLGDFAAAALSITACLRTDWGAEAGRAQAAQQEAATSEAEGEQGAAQPAVKAGDIEAQQAAPSLDVSQFFVRPPPSPEVNTELIDAGLDGTCSAGKKSEQPNVVSSLV